jgi:prefoldin subunit 5
MTPIEQIEVELKMIDDRIKILEEQHARTEQRIRELAAGHQILENTPASVLAKMKEEGRI